MLCGLIMAGGKGTRFWPLSTEEKPKQFLNLVGKKTMIQMTVDRILPIIPIERIFISTGEMYKDLVKEQLPNLPERNIIVEPEGRNTAPCIALSALVIERYYKDSVIAVLPSDHLINDEEEFRKIVSTGFKYLEKNDKNTITLGMTPTRAETGYGYIKCGSEYEIIEEKNIIKVQKFVEKPNEEKAQEYLENGSYLWNGGMFMWKNKYIVDEIKKYIPNTYEALKGIEEVDEEKLQELINTQYKDTNAISIDYAILEKSENIKVIQSNIGWDDIGTWKAVERYKEKDEFNNILSFNSKAIKSNSNMVINYEKKVVMVGVDNIMTIETDDVLFIVHKDYMENLREIQKVL
ncbi:MAG: mannose-1-phosphate guanylyltransferase [Clostridium sp.]|uniref:mannose-1-phosphate guanylyltransferase n=1 Tax=Clostridium sp. TaxID=1506 RepID=UPI003F2AF8F8